MNNNVTPINKIISSKDLEEIFSKFWEISEENKKIEKQEINQNKIYNYDYQKWTTKDLNVSYNITVRFKNTTEITFKDYNNFISIFNHQTSEIERINFYYSMRYHTKFENNAMQFFHNQVYIYVCEDKFEIKFNLEGERLNSIVELIQNKITNAPEKYDRVVKNKSFITSKICFAIGAIPSITIFTLLLLLPSFRMLMCSTYLFYPIGSIILGFFIGGLLCSSKLNHLYKNINPIQKYVGYDVNSRKNIYKDDIDEYIKTSEILIGKNVNNLKDRNEIIELEKTYNKFIPIELIIITFISIIIILIQSIGN